MKEHYVLTIRAEDRRGLIHLVTGTIEKQQAEIKSLNAAPTDIHGIVLVTVEIIMAEEHLTTVALKLENIIEVFSVEAVQHEKAICLRAAYFRIAKTFLDTQNVSVLQKHNAVIVNWYAGAFLVAHHGNDQTVQALYNQLDGPHLLGFSQTGLISESSLISNEIDGRVMTCNEYVLNEERIIRLAA